jgi:hypothetical protein
MMNYARSFNHLKVTKLLIGSEFSNDKLLVAGGEV